MAYRADVEFLDQSNPRLIERTAAEYGRLHTLLASCDDDFRKAGRVEWESEHRERYTRRLKEALDLAEHLSAAFSRVRKALDTYATAVEQARAHFKNGQTTEDRLVEVMSREADAITPTARAAEPLHQWEDLRATTGFLDWAADSPSTWTRSAKKPSTTTTPPRTTTPTPSVWNPRPERTACTRYGQPCAPCRTSAADTPTTPPC